MKEELNKNLEKFRKKNQTEIMEIKTPLDQIKNAVDFDSRRLQVEDRISGLKDKIDTKEKSEPLGKRLKSSEWNKQELRKFIKKQT
jgi:hypothetical protein